MTEAGKDHSRRLIGLAAKAFILASVAAVILPMLQSVGSLGKAQCIVWVARLSWMTSSCERRVFNAVPPVRKFVPTKSIGFRSTRR